MLAEKKLRVKMCKGSTLVIHHAELQHRKALAGWLYVGVQTQIKKGAEIRRKREREA